MFHADGRTDRHDEANSRFSRFCERDYKLTQSSRLSRDNWSVSLFFKNLKKINKNKTNYSNISRGIPTEVPWNPRGEHWLKPSHDRVFLKDVRKPRGSLISARVPEDVPSRPWVLCQPQQLPNACLHNTRTFRELDTTRIYYIHIT